MRKIRTYWWLVLSLLVLVFPLITCSDPIVDMAYESRSALQYPLEVDPEVIGDSDSPLTVNLMAGKNENIGTVELWTEGDNLIVQFDSSWILAETHLDVVSHPSEFPQTKKGNPKPGQFAFKESHSPVVNSYSYSIPLGIFEEGESLYFAAHAEAEFWEEEELIKSEGAWAEGFGFPGANWAMYFAGELPRSVDLTGFWDIYFYPDGMDGFGPMTFYMEQTGSEIMGPYGVNGTISGNEVYLEARDVDMGGGAIDIFLNGILDGNEVAGTLSGGMGTGTFLLVYPSSAPFGDLFLTGQINSVEIDLDTEFALGGTDGAKTRHSVSFSIHDEEYYDGWANHVGFSMWLPEMSPGYKTVTTDDIEETDQVVVLLHHEGGESMADWGSVNIGNIDENHMVLEHFDFHFSDVGSISGQATLYFDEEFGIVSVNWDMYTGNPLQQSYFDNVYSDLHSDTWTDFSLSYADIHLDVFMFMRITGELIPGVFYTPHDFGMSFRWQDDGEGFDEVDLESDGSLTIESYNDDVLAGFFAFEEPFIISGNFNIPLIQSDDPF